MSVATLFLLLFWSSWPQASELRSARGRVSSTDDGAPLSGAVVVVAGAGIGSYADSAGRFVVSRLPSGSYELVVSCLGYRPRRFSVDLTRDLAVEIELTPSAITLPGVIVSATRRTQTFVETPVSMGVASARQIAAHNAFTLAAPLRYQSGVSQIGGQINIRGSSGFSRGTGSRVLLLMDGFPLLSADLGDIKWDAIPVGEVERMEIIKGPGSALYGTGALGGVINLITRQPIEETRTEYRLISGLFSQPAHRSWRWRDEPMYLTGADVSHNRTIGTTGLVAAIGLKRSIGYHENDDFRRYNLYAKGVHRFTRTTWTTRALWALDDHGVFLQWKDRSQPLEVPNEDRQASTASWKFNLNSEVQRLVNPNASYSVRGFYYRTGFDNTAAAGNLNSSAHKVGSEIQVGLHGMAKHQSHRGQFRHGGYGAVTGRFPGAANGNNRCPVFPRGNCCAPGSRSCLGPSSRPSPPRRCRNGRNPVSAGRLRARETTERNEAEPPNWLFLPADGRHRVACLGGARIPRSFGFGDPYPGRSVGRSGLRRSQSPFRAQLVVRDRHTPASW